MGKWSRIIPLVVVSLTALVYAGVDEETIFRDSFENRAPIITSSPITAAGLDFLYSYDVDATDPDGDSLLYLLSASPAGMAIDPVSGLITWTPDMLGEFPVEVDVSDGNRGSDQQAWTILVSEVLDSDGDGLTDEQEGTLGTNPNDPDSDDDGVYDGDEVNVHDTDPLEPDSDTDGFLDGSELAVGTDPLNPDDFPDVPPDPKETAPEPDPSIASNVLDATAFLYTGDDPIQTDVTPDTFEVKRAALLRGKVSTRLGAPLPGVTVSVLGHEEFGSTITRADGMFDLAVNGGGALTIDYRLDGYLPSQRTVDASWQEYEIAPDVALILLDPIMTPIDLDAPGDMKVARGSMVADDDGARRATILFPAGLSAELVMPDGSSQPISNLAVRATEYTVGDSGPEAMPGDLPPTSGYTYAVELSVDEALAAGASSVDFDQPIPFYVENFLGFPAGTPVPTAYYDRSKGAWVPEPDGLVIKIVGETDGLADLDIDGDDVADSGAPLTDLGIMEAERTQIAGLYDTGQSLWRVPVGHFTAWDHNWPIGPPGDATYPERPPPGSDTIEDDTCEASGSIIECQNQVVRERTPVTGTPYTLNYSSNRVPGRETARQANLSLTGTSIPASLKQVTLRVAVAGKVFDYAYDPATSLLQPFTWDGLDIFGKPLQGTATANVRINYVYEGVYRTGGSGEASFGQPGQLPIEVDGNRTRADMILPQEYRFTMGSWDARGHALGGWTLSAHHAYDPANKVLYRGDGTKRSAGHIPDILGMTAGLLDEDGYAIRCNPNDDPTCGDGLPAIETPMSPGSAHIAFGPDGTMYITDTALQRIRRIRPDGIIETFAGTGESYVSGEPNGDGGPALQAKLSDPYSIAVDAQGNVFIGETWTRARRIRKIDTSGIITTYAGTGDIWPPTGPALEVDINRPWDLEVDDDGNLYIVDGCHVIRIDTAGQSSVIAGDSEECGNFSGDGGPAILAALNADGIDLGPDGSIYIADGANYRVRKITKDGIINTIGGTGSKGFSGDGGAAINAEIGYIQDLAVTKEGGVYLPDSHEARIRFIDPYGIIRTVGGLGFDFDESGMFGPPQNAWLYAFYLEIGPDENLYIPLQSNDASVKVIKSSMPGLSLGTILVPSEDGAEVYKFNSAGKHLQTLHALTSAVLLEFGYDADSRLQTITDGDGNITTIQRDGSGNPTSITGPFGQITTLDVDPNGFLQAITNPASETMSLVATSGGLLTRFVDGEGNTSRYNYDDLGRLVRADDAAGGFQTYTRTELANGFEVNRTTALGRTTNFRVERLQTGGQLLTNTVPSGEVFQSTQYPDGSEFIQRPDGSGVQHVLKPDPRFGMQSPLSSITVFTPGGLVSETLVRQTAELDEPDNPLSLQTLTSSITVNGRTVQSVYDAATLTFTDTTPAGRQSHRTIEPSGRLAARQTAGLEASVIEYDGNGRLASMTQGDGVTARAVSFTYGVNGRLASLTDPLLREQTFEYDAADRTVSKTLADGRSVGFDYDENGNTTSIVVPGRPAHVFTYTPRNHVSTSLPPEVGGVPATTTSIYDVDRALDSVTRPDGQVLDYAYDAAGRLMTLFVPGGQYDFSYGTADRLASITAPDGGVLTYTYDGSLLTDLDWTGAITGTVTRTYDAGFRVMSLAVNGQEVPFVYDDDDLVSQAGDLTIQRNPLNGLSEGTTLGQVTGAWSRNNFGEIETYDAEYAGNAVYAVQYVRDVLGRITQKVETVDNVQTTFDYDYDDADRLTEVKTNDFVTESYAYDANGNRLDGPLGTTTYTTDDQDRLLTMVSVAGTTVYGHNNNGERTSKTLGSDIATYAYDMLGNLKTVVLADDTEIEYLIDGRGRRIGKQVYSTLVQGFLYQDGLKPVAELDGSGVVISRFVYSGSTNVPAYFVKGAATYQIISDQVGSPRLVIDVASGAVAQRLNYDSFGNVTLDTNPGFQPFGFAGGLYDVDTGLVRFGFRDYDPEAGRWTTKDPIAFAGGQLNLYSYAINDPVNNVDLTGLAPDSLGTGIGFIDSLNPVKQYFDFLKNLFDYSEDAGKVNDLINDINDLYEDGSRPSGQRGKDAFGKALEICKIVIGRLPGSNPIVKDIIDMSFEAAIDALDEGADSFDNLDETLESIDDGSYFNPTPEPPAGYIPGDPESGYYYGEDGNTFGG